MFAYVITQVSIGGNVYAATYNTRLNTERAVVDCAIVIISLSRHTPHQTDSTQTTSKMVHEKSSLRIDRHFSYWLVGWFIVYVCVRLYDVYVRPSPARPPTPVINPLAPLVVAASANAALTLYTLWLANTTDLATTYPGVYVSVVAYVLANVCIKVVPILLLRYGDRRLFPLPTARDVRRSLVLAAGLSVVWVVWLHVTGGCPSKYGEPTFQDRLRRGVAGGDAPLMRVIARIRASS